MTRHQMRESAFILVFERLFSTDSISDTLEMAKENEIVPLNEQVEALLHGVEQHQSELDQVIEQHLHKWKFSRISKVSLAVLRLAIYEMKYEDDLVDDIVMSEAVKIAQDYTNKEDVAFINGLLSAVSKGTGQPAVLSEAVSSEPVSSEAVPSEAVPSEAVPSEAVSLEPVPSEAVPTIDAVTPSDTPTC